MTLSSATAKPAGGPTRRAVLGLGFAGLTLAACGRVNGGQLVETPGPMPEDTPATGNLVFWGQGAEADALGDFLKPFRDLNPDLNISVSSIPWGAAHNKYQTSIAGGTTPDVAQMGSTWMTDFARSFEVTPEGFDLSTIFDGSVKSTEVQGYRFGVPWYVDTRLFFYRTDLAQAAGWNRFPETWDEFVEFGQALKGVDGVRYPFQLPVSGADSFQSTLPFVWSAGANLTNSEMTRWTFDEPQLIEALDYYRGLFNQGLANKNPVTGENPAGRFIDGSEPVMISGPSGLGDLLAAGGQEFLDKYMVSTVPVKETGTSFVGGTNLVVFKKSRNRDAAWKLIRWLTQPDVQIEFYKKVGSLPSRAVAWDDPALASDERLRVFRKQLEDTNVPPALPTWTQVSAAADTQLEWIVRGNREPADAMQKLQATANRIGVGPGAASPGAKEDA
ncbi:extracellular solute-binding protein [Haematomicrobium sanguinis]|uniref:extracellular solute-binding protein n=1 Tax=Haematomicrobium sanguinis TaxID=479106 RepID=UPI00068BDCF8|nr:extracellular solute-binding protein [Haematomicrobium sanguinis]